MISIIRQEFQQLEAQQAFDQIVQGDPVLQYSSAFEFLQGRRGPEAANRIVKTAVWKALDLNAWPSHLPTSSSLDADSNTCQVLDNTVDAWILPKAVDCLGNLLATNPDTFGRAVLTTNFDPLIEVSIRKHGGQFYRTVLHGDGKLGQTFANGTHVVHLHGYWHGFDTLHTPQQLVPARPELKRSLARVVEESILVVVGYGGWDDVITQTLVELLSDSSSNPEIMWTFHSEDPLSIEASNTKVLRILEPGMARGRVSLYHNIDCRSVFSDIGEGLVARQSSVSTPGKAPSSSATPDSHSLVRSAKSTLLIEVHIPQSRQSTADPDRPLLVDPWVGREQEIDILTSAATPVAFVTGLGGQGKSALAGRLLHEQATHENGRFDFWDWRDCREESDRLSTQILRLAERLSEGRLEARQIETTNIQAVVSMLFTVLSDRHGLLVFDNVDQYIDLETLEPIRGLDVFVNEIQARNHNCLFLFTCRPDVRVDEARAVSVPIDGLTEENVKDLISTHKALKNDHDLASELHQMTDGHPLWVNLILMQAVRHGQRLRGALDVVRQGGSTLPSTTRSIWNQLSEQQRSVLCTMAELDRPEAESQLLELLPGINPNRVNRALKTLKSFYLIETRTRPAKEPLLGLHPIIREFVRTNFPKREREKHVGIILDYFDRMMSRFRELLSKEPSYEILEYWVRKSELQIDFQHFEEATATVAEIAPALVNRGYTEEFIRIGARLIRESRLGEACSSYKLFDSVFEKCLTNMIQTGHDWTEDLLNRYEAAIPGKGTQYILLCDLRCYAYWYSSNYAEAVRWGEEGERLMELTPVDTAYSTQHNLALARRDTGRYEEALDSFLDGSALEAVVETGETDKDKTAPFYGNVGRCLFLMGQLEKALVCYVKSAKLLETGRDHGDNVNRGYIRYWIGELLADQGRVELAAASYRCAMCTWEECSPPRAIQAKEELIKLVNNNANLAPYIGEQHWVVEDSYRNWLNEN